MIRMDEKTLFCTAKRYPLDHAFLRLTQLNFVQNYQN